MSHILIGKRIVKVSLAADREKLLFDFAEGLSIVAKVENMCSETWIASLDNPDALLGTVHSVEDLVLRAQVEVEPHDYRTWYGFKIRTNKGTCVIDYRNSSNGYYGGGLDWPENESEVEEDAQDRALYELQEPDYNEWKQVAPYPQA